ncbi:MAG: dephospho-CoA kinase [Chloroflexota bacterium]
MSRWANKYVIGLTGNIAVGKSVVRQMLQHLGAYTIDADALAHRAMAPGAPAYQPVVDAFGKVILNPDKTINRAILGSMVFSNPALLKQLEAITHPVIGQAIATLVTRAPQKVVVIEAIKLLEGDLGKAVDAVWVVNASPKTQYTRLIAKRKMSEEDAKQRILSQNAQKSKLIQADVVISNDGDIEETWTQVQAAWEGVKKAVTGKTAPVKPAAPEPKPAPAQPQQPARPAAAPQPAPEAAPTPAAEAPAVDTSGVSVRRGMPNQAETIARFINEATGKNINRIDVITSFGQKSYLLAEVDGSREPAALIGWQVENLITRVDELYLRDVPQKEKVIYALVQAIEEASRELQSEVSFIFLPEGTSQEEMQPFVRSGYEATTVKDIKVPAWREAVQELYDDGMIILSKKLRQDRVLKPI